MDGPLPNKFSYVSDFKVVVSEIYDSANITL